MTRILAIATVGTQDVQDEMFDDLVSGGLGTDPKVAARSIGEELASMDDGELAALLEDRPIRNEPCYELLDLRAPEGWTLALLATDQPADVDERFRRSDTIGLADALGRWLRTVRPHVEVLEPYRVRTNPSLLDEPLADEVRAAVTDAVERTDPDEVVVLNVGGTPALRILTEWTVPRVHHGTIERLAPDGEGGVTSRTLLSLIESEQVREQLAEDLTGALRTGRFSTAATVAGRMRHLELCPPAVKDWCEVAARIASDEDEWIPTALRTGLSPDARARLVEIQGGSGWNGRLQGRIALVRRADDDGRTFEALVHWVTAAEMLPRAWAVAVSGAERLTDIVPITQRRCGVAHRRTAPAHVLAARRHAPSQAKLARGLASCATLRCDSCPMGEAPEDAALGRLWADEQGARLASALRDTGPGALRTVRSEYVHADDRRTLDLPAAMHQEAIHLRDLRVEATESLDGLLSAVFEELTGRRPADPFAVIEEEATRLLDPRTDAPG